MVSAKGDIMAQIPPELDISLTMDKINYVINGDVDNNGTIDQNDAIKILITLENTGTESIITEEGFSNQDFKKDLYFMVMNDDGTVISSVTANDLGGGEDSPPPLVIPVVVGGEAELAEVVPVEVIPSGWIKDVPISNAHALYTLPAGYICVKAVISMSTYAEIFKPEGGVDYAELGNFNFADVIESDQVCFYLNSDEDEDNYYYPQPFGVNTIADCNDNDSEVNPGKEEIVGNGIDDDCNQLTSDGPAVVLGMIDIKAHEHAVERGHHPKSHKSPIIGMEVKAFNKADSCVSDIGKISWKDYEYIWINCNSYVSGTTDDDGKVSLPVPPGDYIVIGLYDLDIYLATKVDHVKSGKTKRKKLHLKAIKKHNGKKVAGKHKKRTGSELLIIEPEYIEWDGTEELYPFIFESIGDWSITTSVAPPEGFVSDFENLSEDVYSEEAAIQFTITDLESDWGVDTEVTHDLEHKGKKEKIKSKVGVRLSKGLAKAKGLDKFGKKLEKEKKKKKKK